MYNGREIARCAMDNDRNSLIFADGTLKGCDAFVREAAGR